jgi:hypothetical protein
LNIEVRIKRLEEEIPEGYGTFDSQGRTLIHSLLPGLQWFRAACGLVAGTGPDEEKKFLRKQLAASVGRDNAGGYLYQLVHALACGSVESQSQGQLGDSCSLGAAQTAAQTVNGV